MDMKGLTPTRDLAMKNTGRGKGSFPPREQIKNLSKEIQGALVQSKALKTLNFLGFRHKIPCAYPKHGSSLGLTAIPETHSPCPTP